MFAALSRLAGLLLLPVLLVEYLHQKNWKPAKVDAKIVWTVLAGAGFLIYLGINLQVTGDAFKFMEIQKTHWFNTFDPLKGLEAAISWATTKPYPENLTIGTAPIAFGIFGLVMFGLAVWKRFRPSYLVYLFLTWGLAVSTSWWISVPRYIMAMFPIFILLGALTHKKMSIWQLRWRLGLGLSFSRRFSRWAGGRFNQERIITGFQHANTLIFNQYGPTPLAFFGILYVCAECPIGPNMMAKNKIK